MIININNYITNIKMNTTLSTLSTIKKTINFAKNSIILLSVVNNVIWISKKIKSTYRNITYYIVDNDYIYIK